MRRTLCWMLILGLIISLGMFGCAKKEREVKIGAILALTGDAAQYGQSCKKSLKIWEVSLICSSLDENKRAVQV